MRKKLPWLLPPLLALLVFLWLPWRSVPRHVFLITLDTTRADAIDYAGSGHGRTPNLAALAASGVRFTNAYTVIPITLPSHAAMFYSLPPHVFKIYNNGQQHPVPYPTLAEIMKKKGYATGAVVSLSVLKREFGLARGFDHYLENFRPGLWYRTAAEVNRDAFSLVEKLKGGKSFVWIHYSDPHEPYCPPGPEELFTVALDGEPLHSSPSIEEQLLELPLTIKPGKSIVRLRSEIPAFLSESRGFAALIYADLRIMPRDPQAALTVSYSPDLVRRSERYGRVTFTTPESESHLTVVNEGTVPCRADLAFKYMMKTTEESRRAGYADEVRYLDSQIGRLLAHLKKAGVFSESVFVVMGDHGEGLGEYDSHFGHIHYLNKVYTHVPFFISGKGVRGGEVRGDLVSNFSVAPTVLALAGIQRPRHMAGSDALRTTTEGKLFQETYSPEAYFDAFAVVDFPWQVIFSPGRPMRSLEFFHLETDRHGTVDLHSGPDPSGRRSEMTKSVLRISRIITASKRRHESLNQKTMDTLKSLGYL
ncbi:MAG: sulfatase [Candidatus Aminicenantes bacterium]|nr:sulfatase [Candidatus Aminicenantes bacterium]